MAVVKLGNPDWPGNSVTPLMVRRGRIAQAELVVGPSVGVEPRPALVVINGAVEIVFC